MAVAGCFSHSVVIFIFILLYRARGGIHVALHAQSRYNKHGWVAGSEITTRGLERAFSRHPMVSSVKVFAPFSYEGLHAVPWDLAIVEGYIGTVPRFIREIRRVSPKVRVLHYCLDTYPDLDVIKALDVDGFLTNSWKILPQLGAIAPTEHVLLAVDGDDMRPVREPLDRYRHRVVYLGQMSTTKEGLVPMLESVKDLGLAIYGLGWDRFNESAGLLPYWRGVLPVDDIAALYSSADVVLGTTEEAQRQLGMVNNRVFEALACEAPLVMYPHFAELEEFLVLHHHRPPQQQGRTTTTTAALCAHSVHDVRAHVQRLLADETLRRRMGQEGRRHVLEQHRYDHRVDQIIQFFTRLASSASPPSSRPNIPVVTIAYLAATVGSDWGLYFGLLPAMLAMERQGLCRINTLAIHTSSGPRDASPLDHGIRHLARACNASSLTLLRAPYGHPIEVAFRAMTSCCRGRTGLLMPSTMSTVTRVATEGEEDLLAYSVLGHDDPELIITSHPNAVWTMGILSPAASPPSTPWLQKHSLTIRVGDHRRGTVVSVHRKVHGDRNDDAFPTAEEQEMDHVRPETLFALMSAASEVTIIISSGGAEQPGGVVALVLLGVWAGAEVVVETSEDSREALAAAIAMTTAAEQGSHGASPFVDRLSEAVNRGLFGLSPRAKISIDWPTSTDLLLFTDDHDKQQEQQRLLTVEVSTEAFTVLTDGYWCLRVDGQEVACVGDDVWRVTLDVAAWATAKTRGAAATSSSRSGSTNRTGTEEEEGRWSQAELQAVLLSGGLEFPEVWAASTPVTVRALL